MLTWLLAVYGMTLIITGSKLLEPVRERIGWEVLQCPMCLGWWVGLGAALIGWPMPGVPGGSGLLARLALPASAFAASAVCWILHVVLAALGAEEL